MRPLYKVVHDKPFESFDVLYILSRVERTFLADAHLLHMMTSAVLYVALIGFFRQHQLISLDRGELQSRSLIRRDFNRASHRL